MSSKARTKQASQQEEEIVERTAPPGGVVYQAIYREGEHELERSLSTLSWSGIGAGLAMGFSFLMEGFLRHYLPKADWQPAVAKFGYCVGFLIVILGRQQLFTKNTLTVILPLLKLKQRKLLIKVMQLWAGVLATNMLGALIFAYFIHQTEVCPAEVREQFTAMGREAFGSPFGTVLCRAILSGWLIALMIWLLPFAESAHFWVILLLSYLLGLGHLPHIVAGSIPALYAVFNGEVSILHWVTAFFLPVLIGNCLGGVTVVAIGAHVEFVKESPKPPHRS
jgi:formate/nitrite transporter FocA (FNT family)